MGSKVGKWKLLCGARGPWDEQPDWQGCQLVDGHADSIGARWHQCWNDDGSVMVKWVDDWKHGDGRWREGQDE